MEIKNARIENVTVGLDDRNRLSAKITFEGNQGQSSWCHFVLTKTVEAQHLRKLMLYTGAYKIDDLNGKIVRKVEHEHCLCGFGDPIEDKFIWLEDEELKELTESQIVELLSKIK